MVLSIIVPNYNNGLYLVKCIESVIEQSYRPLELIIVDDCSTDNSREIILEYSNKYEWITGIFLKTNMGVSNARNAGAQKAKGDLLTFLDADDFYFSPQKIQREIELLLLQEQNGKKNIVPFCIVTAVSKKNNVLWIYHTKKYFKGEKLKKDILCEKNIQYPRDYCFRRELFDEVGGYIPGMSLYEDTEFLLRLANKCDFICTNQQGTAYRITKQGLSSVAKEIHRVEFGKIRKQYMSFYPGYVQGSMYLVLGKNRVKAAIKKVCKVIAIQLGVWKEKGADQE